MSTKSSEAARTSLALKALMAVTGIALFGFVLAHMAGNLKMYQGAESYNAYAAWLREVGYPALPHGAVLNVARIGLLAAVFGHIWASWRVTRQSRQARPQRYVRKGYVQADWAVRTMGWGGVVIVLFVIYHLLHLTWGTVHPDYLAHDEAGYHVYHNIVAGFQSWPVVIFYLAANVALGFHLYHGLWSLFQTLGWNHPRFNRYRRLGATAFAFLVTAGNLSFPIAVLTGIVS